MCFLETHCLLSAFKVRSGSDREWSLLFVNIPVYLVIDATYLLCTHFESHFESHIMKPLEFEAHGTWWMLHTKGKHACCTLLLYSHTCFTVPLENHREFRDSESIWLNQRFSLEQETLRDCISSTVMKLPQVVFLGFFPTY